MTTKVTVTIQLTAEADDRNTAARVRGPFAEASDFMEREAERTGRA